MGELLQQPICFLWGLAGSCAWDKQTLLPFPAPNAEGHGEGGVLGLGCLGRPPPSSYTDQASPPCLPGSTPRPPPPRARPAGPRAAPARGDGGFSPLSRGSGWEWECLTRKDDKETRLQEGGHENGARV